MKGKETVVRSKIPAEIHLWEDIVANKGNITFFGELTEYFIIGIYKAF